MAEPKDIVINGWQAGIGPSPITGFGDMRNVDIHNPQGILKIAPAPTKISSTTVLNLPTWITRDTDSTLDWYLGGYQDGTNASIYKINSSTVTAPYTGSILSGTRGGLVWKDYLFVVDWDTNNTYIDVMKLSNGTWTNNWKTLTSTSANSRTAPMIWGQDDILYIGNGRYVASLEELTTFAPGDAGSYTWNSAALDIPDGYWIESLSELGKYLMIGASKHYGATIQDVFEGRIFPWDRTSSSFELPIILDRGGVRQMISQNGKLVFANGQKGDYLSTNASSISELPEIGTLKQLNNSVGAVLPEAKAYVNGEYLFGISSESTSFAPAGIYGYKNGAWRFLEISTGNTGTSNSVYIGCIANKDDRKFFVGWKDPAAAAQGIDEFGYSDYLYTGYKAYVESPLYQVGSGMTPRTFQRMRVTFNKELSTGHGIRISWRSNLSDSFTTIHTIDTTTYPGTASSTSIELPFNPTCDFIQIKAELTTAASSTTGPELVEIRLT